MHEKMWAWKLFLPEGDKKSPKKRIGKDAYWNADLETLSILAVWKLYGKFGSGFLILGYLWHRIYTTYRIMTEIFEHLYKLTKLLTLF